MPRQPPEPTSGSVHFWGSEPENVSTAIGIRGGKVGHSSLIAIERSGSIEVMLICSSSSSVKIGEVGERAMVKGALTEFAVQGGQT